MDTTCEKTISLAKSSRFTSFPSRPSHLKIKSSFGGSLSLGGSDGISATTNSSPRLLRKKFSSKVALASPCTSTTTSSTRRSSSSLCPDSSVLRGRKSHDNRKKSPARLNSEDHTSGVSEWPVLPATYMHGTMSLTQSPCSLYAHPLPLPPKSPSPSDSIPRSRPRNMSLSLNGHHKSRDTASEYVGPSGSPMSRFLPGVWGKESTNGDEFVGQENRELPQRRRRNTILSGTFTKASATTETSGGGFTAATEAATPAGGVGTTNNTKANNVSNTISHSVRFDTSMTSEKIGKYDDKVVKNSGSHWVNKVSLFPLPPSQPLPAPPNGRHAPKQHLPPARPAPLSALPPTPLGQALQVISGSRIPPNQQLTLSTRGIKNLTGLDVAMFMHRHDSLTFSELEDGVFHAPTSLPPTPPTLHGRSCSTGQSVMSISTESKSEDDEECASVSNYSRCSSLTSVDDTPPGNRFVWWRDTLCRTASVAYSIRSPRVSDFKQFGEVKEQYVGPNDKERENSTMSKGEKEELSVPSSSYRESVIEITERGLRSVVNKSLTVAEKKASLMKPLPRINLEETHGKQPSEVSRNEMNSSAFDKSSMNRDPSPTLSEAEIQLEKHLSEIERKVSRDFDKLKKTTRSCETLGRGERTVRACPSQPCLPNSRVKSQIQTGQQLYQMRSAIVPGKQYHQEPSLRQSRNMSRNHSHPVPKFGVSTDAADRILKCILSSLHCLQDLFNAALINRGFYQVFKRYELYLIRQVLRTQEQAAWEYFETLTLRDVRLCQQGSAVSSFARGSMSQKRSISNTRKLRDTDKYSSTSQNNFGSYFGEGEDELSSSSNSIASSSSNSASQSPLPFAASRSAWINNATTYMRLYLHDSYVVLSLKQLLLERCKAFLRPTSITALAHSTSPFQRPSNVYARNIDSAFWRIWNFCRLFGESDTLQRDIPAQLAWLNGQRSPNFDYLPSFSRGNNYPFGLTMDQLRDMLELWNCFGVLLQSGITDFDTAFKFGVFDSINLRSIRIEPSALIHEFRYHILSLGLFPVYTISSLSVPRGLTEAKCKGWTKWNLPSDRSSRSNFFVEPVVRMLEAKRHEILLSAARHNHHYSGNSLSSSNYRRPSQQGDTSFSSKFHRRRPSGHTLPRPHTQSNLI